MARPRGPSTTVDRLLDHLLDGGRTDPMADELGEWLTGSRRFRAFVELYRDKTRKKLRSAVEHDARRDVRTEFRVAHLLLGDRRIELAFEAYGSTSGGPDFTVAYRGQPAFNLEVTRSRASAGVPTHGGPLLTKLRQLPPSVPNVMLIAIPGEAADALDIAATARALRDRANSGDDAFFERRGFKGSRGFQDRLRRLGAVIVWSDTAVGEARTALWINPVARIGVPDRALRACLERLRER